MAGRAVETLRIAIDQKGMDKLQEKGKVAIGHPSEPEKYIVIVYDDCEWETAKKDDDRPGIV